MSNAAPVVDLDDLIGRIDAGATLAVPPDFSGVAMAATRAHARRGPGRLHLVACLTSGLQADMLIGAGRVATLEAAAIGLGEFGPAPRFTDAVRTGAITLVTGRAVFSFDRARRRFRLESVHPGDDVDDIVAATGFGFDRPAMVPPTLAPPPSTLALIRGPVREQIAETYPRFAATVLGPTAFGENNA